MNPEDVERRIRELEEENRRLRFIAESHKEAAYELLRREFPYESPSPEEIQRMREDTEGKPILEIIAEFEREIAERA